MERFFDENLKNQRSVNVFFDPPKEEIWNSFSPSLHERDNGEFSEIPYGTLNETVLNMQLHF